MSDERQEPTGLNSGARGWLICAGLTALTAVIVLKAAVMSMPELSGILAAWYVQAGIVAGAVAAYAIGEATIGRAHRHPAR